MVRIRFPPAGTKLPIGFIDISLAEGHSGASDLVRVDWRVPRALGVIYPQDASRFLSDAPYRPISPGDSTRHRATEYERHLLLPPW